MLCERLMLCKDYDASWERHNLELLKTRFGEGALTNCDVMLQDIKDSSRNDKKVQDVFESSKARPAKKKDKDGLCIPQMHALMLSHAFWPNTLKKEEFASLRLPSQFETTLQQYSKLYSEVFSTRKLEWKRNRGTVRVKLQLKDRVVELEINPIQASIIACFHDESSKKNAAPIRKSIADISATIDVTEDIVRKFTSLFLSKGVLREVESSVYEVMEEKSAHVDVLVEDSEIEDEQRGSMDSEQIDKMQNFITGILGTYTELPFSRIHNFLLQMCMTDDHSIMTEAQLKEFLSVMVQNGKLKTSSGKYSLLRTSS